MRETRRVLKSIGAAILVLIAVSLAIIGCASIMSMLSAQTFIVAVIVFGVVGVLATVAAFFYYVVLEPEDRAPPEAE